MTRLYNHTKYPDQILKDILNFAARCAGVEGDVPVKITHCTHLRGGGEAHDNKPYLKTLKGRPTTSKDKRTLNCPRGWVGMHLPRTLGVTPQASLVAAEWFVDVAIHEMAHVRQYRTFKFYNPAYYGRVTKGGRRVAHDKRPCEVDANNTVDATRENRARDRRRQELAIELAIILEGTN